MKRASIDILGRVLLATIFIGLGLERLLVALDVLPASGIGSTPAGLAFGLIELAAGLLLALGWQARRLALGLVLFLLVDALLSHPFWRHIAGPAQHEQLLHFLKNLAMIGGLLLVRGAVPDGSASTAS